MLATLVLPMSPAVAADEDDPLRVTITNITPSSIPRSGPVTITGQVRNDSDETWSDVRVYPLFSATPMTTPDELAEAVESDPLTTNSGSRLTGEGQFVEFASLAPGRTASFRIRLPRREVPVSGAAGVYWVGAQALGSNADGRDALADGRARSFLPLVPRNRSARLSLIAPLRQHVERDVRARIVDEAGVAALFRAGGRLGRLVSTLAQEADVTWLVDPAVLDAAADLGDDNPPMTLGPDQPEEPRPSPTPGTATSQGAPAPALDDQARQIATTWLSNLTGVLSRSVAPVLALPYADADALALLRREPDLLARAHDLSTARLKARGLDADSAIATPTRHLDEDLMGRAGGTVVAVTEAAEGPAVAARGDQRIVLGAPRAADGGPGPRPATSALNMRQRILAEAALEAIAGRTDPVVVTLPDDWDPGAFWQQADFTGGLETDWLDLAPLPSGATGQDRPELRYTRADQRAEIDGRLIGAAQRLLDAGDVLASLLETDNNVALRLRAMAFGGASYSSRADQSAAGSLLTTMTDTVTTLTDKVHVVGTEFVTLSGGSGTITVSLLNDLPQPIRIGLDVSARDKDNLSFEEIEPVTLAPQQRTTMRLAVRTSRFGVNEVSISPVTTDGRAVGTPLDVTIRSSEVGRWFWSVMIGAGCVLVVMIAKRIRDRIRTRHWRPVEDDETA